MFWDAYIGIIYGILYLCFIAYPIVFTGVRGWSTGLAGLAFTGLAVGCFLVIGSEPLIRRMINSHKKDPETGKVPPEAMVSVLCIAAVLVPVGELWFAWTWYVSELIVPYLLLQLCRKTCVRSEGHIYYQDMSCGSDSCLELAMLTLKFAKACLRYIGYGPSWQEYLCKALFGVFPFFIPPLLTPSLH